MESNCANMPQLYLCVNSFIKRTHGSGNCKSSCYHIYCIVWAAVYFNIATIPSAHTRVVVDGVHSDYATRSLL